MIETNLSEQAVQKFTARLSPDNGIPLTKPSGEVESMQYCIANPLPSTSLSATVQNSEGELIDARINVSPEAVIVTFDAPLMAGDLWPVEVTLIG